MSDGLLSRAGLGLLRRPGLTAAAVLAAAALAAFGLSRIRLDPNVEHLLPPGDPTLRLTRHLQGDESPARILFVVLRGADAAALDEAVPAAAEALRASPLLVRVCATRADFAGPRIDWVKRSIPSFLPPETLDALEERLAGPGRAAELGALKRRMAEDPLGGKAAALADPLGLRWIFDEASDRLAGRFPARLRPGSPHLVVEKPAVAFLRGTGREDASDMPTSRAVVADVRARLEAVLAPRGIGVELAGGYVSAVASEAALKRDMIVETVVSAIAVLLYVWWFARSFLAAHLVFVPVVLSIAGSLAAGGAVFGTLTPIVMSSAAILIAQGIDFPVHYFCRYRAERGSRGLVEALHTSQVSIARPFAGIAATTLVAFLSLMVSRFPGFRQFGFVLALGMLLCLVTALVVFPVLLLPADRFVKPAAATGLPWIVRGAEALLRTRARRPLAWVLVLLGLGAWAWVARSGIRMDLDLRSAMAPGDPGRAALERLEGDLGAAMMPVYALVDGSLPLEELRERAGRLQATGKVASADGPHALFPSPAALDRAARFRERTRGWVDGTLADLARLGFKPEPFRRGLEEMQARFAAPAPVAADLDLPAFAALRRAARYDGEGPARHVLLLFSVRSVWREDERADFDRAVRGVLGEDVRFYSPFHLPDHYSELLDEDLGRVSILTSLGIVILTLLAVGGWRDGLYALAPVALATGMTLAAVVFMGGRVNVINMAAIPIILAVGVDGGIHFMVRFRESRDRDPAAVIREVGPGIWGSAATTLLGFGSIATSVTPGMAQMGYLVVVGTVTSVLASLFLLPGLLEDKISAAQDSDHA